MLEISSGDYRIHVAEEIPALHDTFLTHARRVESFDLAAQEAFLFVAVSLPGDDWPSLVVQQRYGPGGSSGFTPGLLVAPETGLLLIGAGTRLLAYDLPRRVRIWEDATPCGFWGWRRHDEAIVMSAELEIAGLDLHGRRLWSRDVEPPWTYAVDGDRVLLDVMGETTMLSLATGEPV